MLYPKLDVLKSKVNSKYMLVSLASKRARELFCKSWNKQTWQIHFSIKEVGKALEEIAEGKISVLEK